MGSFAAIRDKSFWYILKPELTVSDSLIQSWGDAAVNFQIAALIIFAGNFIVAFIALFCFDNKYEFKMRLYNIIIVTLIFFLFTQLCGWYSIVFMCIAYTALPVALFNRNSGYYFVLTRHWRNKDEYRSRKNSLINSYKAYVSED